MFAPDYTVQSNQPEIPLKRFKLTVDGEYHISERGIDQAFTLTVLIKPVFNDHNFVTWDMDYNLDLESDDLIPVISFFLFSFLTGNFLTGSILFFLFKGISEQLLESNIVPYIRDGMGDVSFFDTIPNKFVVERRRWDPFYECEHQLVTSISQLDITREGFVMAGEDLYLGKKIIPVPHVVPRNELRGEGGVITALQYRVKDYGSIPPEDFVNVFSATDRMPVQRILDPEGIETHLAELTFDQISDRASHKCIQKKIPYKPVKVHIVEGQIYQLLLISEYELLDIPADYKRTNRSIVSNEIRSQYGSELREQAIAELTTEFDETPTEDDINSRFEKLLSDRIELALNWRAHQEIERRLKFDMEPDEFADLIKRKIIALPGYMIQTRRREDGGVTTFLRDDFPYFGGDDKNLIDLPGFRSEVIVR